MEESKTLTHITQKKLYRTRNTKIIQNILIVRRNNDGENTKEKKKILKSEKLSAARLHLLKAAVLYKEQNTQK